MFLEDITPLMTHAAVAPRSCESGLALILSFPSHNSTHNRDPVSPSTRFLNSDPKGSGFLMTNDRLGRLPDFVVLRKNKHEEENDINKQ